MRHDWTEKRKGRPTGHGSVFRFDPALHGFLYEELAAAPYHEVEKARGSEQRYTSHKAMDRGQFVYIPEPWVVSFKYDCNPFPGNYLRKPELPEDARVVCFHGHPKMPEAIEGYRGSLIRYAKPCDWLQDHWVARAPPILGPDTPDFIAAAQVCSGRILARPRVGGSCPTTQWQGKSGIKSNSGRGIGMRRVVVTGLGLVTPLATGVEESWSRLIAGQSGAGPITRFDTSNVVTNYACEVKRGDGSDGTFNADDWMEPKEQRKVDDFILYGMAAAVQAVRDAGWDSRGPDRLPDRRDDRLGYRRADLDCRDGGPDQGTRARDGSRPFFIPGALINLISGQVSIRFGFKGPNHSVVTACSTGAHAIGDAARLIRGAMRM